MVYVPVHAVHAVHAVFMYSVCILVLVMMSMDYERGRWQTTQIDSADEQIRYSSFESCVYVCTPYMSVIQVPKYM